MGRGSVKDVQVGGDMGKPMADYMLMFGRNQHNTVKAIILPLKTNFFKRLKKTVGYYTFDDNVSGSRFSLHNKEQQCFGY